MKKKIKKSILLLAIFLMLPNFVLAAPSISSVSGNISDGEIINISGNSFGSAPNVVVFDDFESGVVGANIKTGPGSAKFGQWDERAGSSFYGSTAKVSGTKSFSSDFLDSYTNYIQANLPTNTVDVFISWWLYLPSGNNWPGEGTQDGDNWKQMWIQGANTADDDLVTPIRQAGDSWLVNGNDKSSCSPALCGPGGGYTKYVDVTMVKGSWKRLHVWLKGASGTDAENGETKLWELTGTGVSNLLNDIDASNLKTGGYREKVRPNGYGRKTPNCLTSFDDIYIATGPNAQARVEIGNASTYASSTKLTILTPTSWSEDSISAQVNVGNFSTESAYLYVFDSFGAVNVVGYPITIGESSSDTTAPNSPSGLSVL